MGISVTFPFSLPSRVFVSLFLFLFGANCYRVLMENVTRSTKLHDFHLASRKAEEAALRRYQAVHWLECLVGPLGISDQPSDREFISCLRNGLILCNAINKIQPGSVPKVVGNHLPTQSVIWDSQPLPAYQYFENVGNFLVAVEELKLCAFEASDIETGTFEAGSVARIVDCILALKSYHELKQINWGHGSNKHVKSPLVLHSASKNFSRRPNALSTEPCRCLDMSTGFSKESPEEYTVKALTDIMADTKENIDNNFLASLHTRNLDPVKALSKILGSCLEEQLQHQSPEDILREQTHTVVQSASVSKGNRPAKDVTEPQCRACFTKSTCEHWHFLQKQEKDLSDIKSLLSQTKREFEDLQAQFFNDLKQLGSQVQEMSTAGLGYQKVVQENRYLYNMVQDLKGNIRVCCRIRPTFNVEAKDVIDFIGEDGSLVIVDPSKRDERKVFLFNRVYGPIATQDEVFKNTRPLIRSVMDFYNVCISAYGQTRSGKTYTMVRAAFFSSSSNCGPSGGLAKDMGINYFALNDLFQLSNQRKDIISYDIYAQMVEIYNEQVRDLLAEESSSTKLEIRSHHTNDGLSLPDAALHSVKSTVDVLNLMKHGDENHTVNFTAMNNQSSRSHSVLTVHVHGKDTSGNILHSRLYLVDLARSERVDKSEVTGDRLKEAQHINKSLSCLGDVFTALSQKSSYIPYRNSKITLLLPDALGGHAKTLMFAHVSPEGDDFGETLGTLKFARRVSSIELGAACLNKQSSEVRELKQQIENLKKALVSKKTENLQQLNNHPTNKTPSLATKHGNEPSFGRGRRLSLGVAKNGTKDHLQIELPEDVCKFSPLGSVTPYRYQELQEGQVVSTSNADFRNSKSPVGSGDPAEVMLTGQATEIPAVKPPKSPEPHLISRNYRQTALHYEVSKDHQMPSRAKSPPSFAQQQPPSLAGYATKIPTIKSPKSPEQQCFGRNVHTALGTEASRDCQAPITVKSAWGKGSQIMKSLRTIGKLINGSVKRTPLSCISVMCYRKAHGAKLQEPAKDRSTYGGRNMISDPKSPNETNARALRRQSLTGIPSAGSDHFHRSSLGNGGTYETRNAKSPISVCSSTKAKERWM